MTKLVAWPALLDTFQNLCSKASSVEIVVAWVGEGKALDALIAQIADRNIPVRIVVGLDGNITQPAALRRLAHHAELRVTKNGRGGYFHPKFYRFKSRSTATCLVGSANLTNGGFRSNDELMVQFDDADGVAGKWFKSLWDTLPDDPSKDIERYIADYKPPRPLPRAPAEPEQVSIRAPHRLLAGKRLTWDEYVLALKKCDTYWSRETAHVEYGFTVLGEGMSWLNTIEVGHRICHRSRWDGLSEDDREVLMPARLENDGAWGLLGSMGSAARARSEFFTDRERRTELRRYIAPAMAAETEDDFIAAAADAIEQISAIPRFGPGVATRLLALARPDRAVSVNKGCFRRLRIVVPGLPRTPHIIGGPRHYPDLLRWVYDQPWYQSPRPDNVFEARLWDQRAALIDCFVYGWRAGAPA